MHFVSPSCVIIYSRRFFFFTLEIPRYSIIIYIIFYFVNTCLYIFHVAGLRKLKMSRSALLTDASIVYLPDRLQVCAITIHTHGLFCFLFFAWDNDTFTYDRYDTCTYEWVALICFMRYVCACCTNGAYSFALIAFFSPPPEFESAWTYFLLLWEHYLCLFALWDVCVFVFAYFFSARARIWICTAPWT